MTTAADVDAIDREYLALVAEAASKPPTWDAAARARQQAAGNLAAAAAKRLCAAITDHDLAVYGELLPEETP